MVVLVLYNDSLGGDNFSHRVDMESMVINQINSIFLSTYWKSYDEYYFLLYLRLMCFLYVVRCRINVRMKSYEEA